MYIEGVIDDHLGHSEQSATTLHVQEFLLKLLVFILYNTEGLCKYKTPPQTRLITYKTQLEITAYQ